MSFTPMMNPVLTEIPCGTGSGCVLRPAEAARQPSAGLNRYCFPIRSVPAFLPKPYKFGCLSQVRQKVVDSSYYTDWSSS